MRRWLLPRVLLRGLRAPALTLGLALSPCSTARAEPAPDPEPPPQIAARSTIVMRLDPRAPQDPRGAVGIGLFRVLARDGYDAEAAGWIGHAPHAPGRPEAPVTGDVTTLRLRAPYGPAWVEVGRHWSAIGGQRLTGLDGLTAAVRLTERLDAAARAGRGLPPIGGGSGDAFGEAFEVGGEARLRFDDGFARVGVLNARAERVPTRTRWTLAGGYAWSPAVDAHGAVTADVISRAVADARLEVAARPSEALRLRGYGRYARVEELLPATDLLSVFAPDPRGELGALGEWQLATRWRLLVDGAWVGVRPSDVGARWRSAVEWLPRPGAWTRVEGTARVERHGHSATLRLAGRWPLRGTLFGTVEAVGDVEKPGGAPSDGIDLGGVDLGGVDLGGVDLGGVDLGGVARLGLGVEPWAGWVVYGALQGARTPRWSERLGGVMVIEYALGAPVRWGGAP